MKKYGKLIISDNGIAARENGAIIKNQISKKWFLENFEGLNEEEKLNITQKIDIKKISAKQIKVLADESWSGEWHHSSKFANKIKYYWFNDIQEFLEDNTKEKIEKNLLSVDEQLEKIEVKGEYAIWGGSKKHPKIEAWKSFEGTLKGDWIYLKDGSRKKIDGNWIKWERIKNIENIKPDFEIKKQSIHQEIIKKPGRSR